MRHEKSAKSADSQRNSSNASDCNAWSFSPNLCALFCQGARRTRTKDEPWINGQRCSSAATSFELDLVCRGPDKYGGQPAPTWPLGGNPSPALPFPNHANQLLMVPKGWRNGDWICNCGFHNYSSRAQCKKCNASCHQNEPHRLQLIVYLCFGYKALGMKRLASEEFVRDWDSKRLNAGHANGQQPSYPGFEQLAGSSVDPKGVAYAPYPSVTPVAPPNLQVPMQFPHQTTTPTLLGKGAKQWRDGTGCAQIATIIILHLDPSAIGYLSFLGGKTQRDALAQPVSVA
ncbi:hypothetical protein CK203_006053 [Vitis vinifera]|uniref:RanBP2-type domain-containing protein n=1 Tax=Vitis vinifera TaxID=29760 RepID=A0A438K5L6_VITVI|nr:hypothetical protein CK203_006053 [Vitis vinifera]